MPQFKTMKTASTEPLKADEAPIEKPIFDGDHVLVEKPVEDQKGPPSEPSDQPQPSNKTSGFKFWLTLIGLNMSIFCVALDNTIISTAIPRITDDFHALQDVGWYGSGYLLAQCAFQLFFGKLYHLFEIKWVYMTALFIFELGSLICAVAPTSPVLIAGRAIAGVGSAGIFSGALIIVAMLVPLEKRPLYQGAFGGMFGVASILGPLIGGAFTDNVTWRWCFYINLPIGGMTAVLVVLFLKLPPNGMFKSLSLQKSLIQLDPLGTVLFMPSIVCLLLALQWGGTTYPFSDGRIISLFVVFGITLIAFIGVQWWMGESATVPPRIGTQRTIASSSLFILCLAGANFLLIYFLPIWFQAVLGVDALQSGIDTIALILANTFGILFSGVLTSKTGYYMPYVLVCVVFTSIGSGLLTTLSPASSTARWIGYQILYGFGCGCAFQLPQIAAQTVLPAEDVPIGVAITLFFTMLGGSVFVSAANNVLNNTLVQNLSALGIPNAAGIASAGATQLRALVPANLVLQAVEAYNGAVVKTFEVALVLSCLSLVGALGMEWKSVKKGNEAREEATRVRECV